MPGKSYDKIIQELRERIIKEKDFGKLLNFFFDHLGEDPEFIARGKPARHEVLELAIERAVKEMIGKHAKIRQLLLVFVPEYRFYHGSFVVDGNIGTVFYFDDIQIGLMNVAMGFTGEIRMARITVQSSGEIN